MEYNYIDMAVQPVLPKAVADEQLLVFVPIANANIHGLFKINLTDFNINTDGLLSVNVDDAIVEGGTGFARTGLIYSELAKRDASIKNLQDNKQDKAISLPGFTAKTVEGSIVEVDEKTKTNKASIDSLNRQVGQLDTDVKEAKTLAQSAKTAADKATSDVEDIQKTVASHTEAITALQGTTTEQEAAIAANATEIATLKNTVNTQDGLINDLMDKDTELSNKITKNTQDIATNKDNIATNTTDIANLKQAAYGGETPIGTYPSAATLPTSAQLTAFVQQQVSRAPKLGDVILFTQLISGGTDKSYKFMYTATGWSNYVIPTVESASNTDKGIVQGTYASSATGNTVVDIQDGKIVAIYVKTTNGYKDVKAFLEDLVASINSTNATVAANKNASDTGIAEAKAAAAAVIKKQNNVTFTLASSSDTTMEKFPCKYTANIAGVTADNVVDVYFSAVQIPLEIFSSYVQVEAGKVSIFATTATQYPTSVTVPTVRIS